MTLQLYQFPGAWGLPSESPFCLKVETYLRMAQIPYETVTSGNVWRAPKGKLPYIRENGAKLGDSNFIVEYLSREYRVDLDAHLSVSERSIAHSFKRLIEEHLYWCIIHDRWVNAMGWAAIEPLFFEFLPPLIRTAAGRYYRRVMIAQLRGQGMGRHSSEEIYALGKKDLQSLIVFLADKPFFMGEQPSLLDATAYGFLETLRLVPTESSLQRTCSEDSKLRDYCMRMKAAYYPEQA